MPKTIGKIKLYSLKELSKKLDVTTTTLRHYLAAGELKGRKMGGCWMVTEDNLHEYFNNSNPIKKKAKSR